MSPEERLGAIVTALESVEISCLVMGGHAVRYYGLHRYTNDFDLALAPEGWDDLADRLARTGLFPGKGPKRFADSEIIRIALARATNPITQAFLLPWVPDAVAATPVVVIEPLVERKLRSITPASSLHRSLVEVVRRQYKIVCQDRDRADKERIPR